MKFLSLFSGIEAASVAWKSLGWKPVAFAEIEPFPCAVLAHHYPDVPNLGDVTKITDQQVAALGTIDIVIGGSPCQDLSVAGRRAGLAGERSGLFHEQVRIFHAARKYCGARFLVWENVRGAFSSNKGRDFAVVVGALAGLDPASEEQKWGNEGVALGEHGLLEWCVLDAQWFGVAQRRRRVFAVLDTGDWRNRPPILLEPASLRGDSPPSRKAGKDVAPTIAARTRGGGGLGTDFDCDGGLIVSTGDVSHYLNAGGMGPSSDGDGDGAILVPMVAPTLQAGGNSTGGNRPPGTTVDTCDSLIVTHSLRAEGFDASEDGTGRGTPIVTVQVAPCLTSNYGKQPDNSDTHAGPMLVLHPIVSYAIQAGALRQNPESGPDGVGVQPDIAYTLEARAEVQCVAFDTTQITSPANGSNPQPGDPCHTLAKGSHAPAIAFNASQDPDVSGLAVRRLTPRECERLQGFPDDYTRIPQREYARKRITALRPPDRWEPLPNGHWMLMSADGPRYKALGNSFAVPCMRWIGQQIQKAVDHVQ